MKKTGRVTEAALATALDVDERTVRRWVAAGIPSGRAGRHRTFDLAEARAWVTARSARAGEAILLKDRWSTTLDFRDRLRLLVEERVATDAWLPAWRTFVAWASAFTEPWPERIAATCSALTSKDETSIDPPSPFPGRERLVVYPLLYEFSDAAATVEVPLDLDPPDPEPEPAEPKNAEGAREIVREARTTFREYRIAVRRGHRREDVAGAVDSAVSAWPLAWLSWSRHDLADLVFREPPRPEVLAASQECRQARLASLATLGGFLK